METKSWKEIKNEVYGEKGTVRRDELERELLELNSNKEKRVQMATQQTGKQ